MKNTYIALDTNIWIYLASPSGTELLTQLENKVDDGSTSVVLNDIIETEWRRNREKTLSNLVTLIREQYQKAKDLCSFVQDEEKKQTINDLLTLYNAEDERIKEAHAAVARVEALMSKCIKIKVTPEQKLYVAEMAIHGIPPMANHKNNFNDALIVRNLAEYVHNCIIHEGSALPNKYDLIYVSKNLKDFVSEDTKEVYPKILEGFEQVRLVPFHELRQALFQATELIDDFDEWLEWQLEMQAEYEFDLRRGK